MGSICCGITEESRQTGEIIRVTDQPEVRITFTGELDANNPQLIAVKGVGGFGLRLEDNSHHPVPFGSQGESLVLNADSSDLTFWLHPQRTGYALQEEPWHSIINMRFSYE